ncbi:hypothetical protein BDW42DRAFT_163661 [Aspergillus taichungensis]|uniref:Uncharacterized protein n=1 Tax=Aspergillus taichungensis TaxID=482145 RepID=A0A2J5I2V1_9EURO|nr:hypothetical protein BDW42DRAFT_163661 [Aspergillus taichungensis]
MEEQLRDLIMNQIHGTIKDFLKGVDSTPIRILGDTPTRILDSGDYLRSISEFAMKVQASVRECRQDSQARFLAVNIYPQRHSYFVVDLNNKHYNYETAHKDTTPIPVYVLRLSRRPRIFRFQDQDEKLAMRLAEMHNGHGRDPLPLFDDFTKIVQYHSPRSLQT